MGRICAVIALFISLTSTLANAKLVQILHTNDLHGFLENAVENEALGGYARIKTMIDHYKAEAGAEGIESLVLDAGDFLEGSFFYFAERGRRVWNVMNEMGYDAVVVGNHDYLMGTEELNAMLKSHPPRFTYLGANFKIRTGRLFNTIRNEVKDYRIFNIGGVKLGIVGVTTDERLYRWRFNGGKITSPFKSVNKIARKLIKKELADNVIALTHIGILRDIRLAKESKHVDLIVGGHSHTTLFKPVLEKNKNGYEVPIVQTGEHGKYLGRMLIDVEKGRPIKIVKYELIPVVNKEQETDELITSFVADTRKILEKEYKKEWLEEEIGESRIPLVSSDLRLTPWTALISDAIKEAVDADISFHQTGFAGCDLPAGKITREQIIQSHPRVFDLDDRYGWKIYSVDVYGVMLKSIVRLVLKGQQALAFSGITFDLLNRQNEELHVNLSYLGDDINNEEPDWDIVSRYLGIDGKYRVTNIRVNGEPISPYKRYRVALNEGVVVGGLGVSGVVKYLLRRITRTDVTIWKAIMDKVGRVGVITSEYGDRYYNDKELGHHGIIPTKKIPYRP